MMQEWADYLDRLREGEEKIVPLIRDVIRNGRKG
jgi:hypothetical protein